jgi:hypothetical protein
MSVGAGERLVIASTGPRDTITSSTLTPSDADALWAKSLTQFAMNRDGLSSYERQLRQAYGDKTPGSAARWPAKAPEREPYERMIINNKAWKLYRRVHGEPCAAELRRLEFERETRATLRRQMGLDKPSEASEAEVLTINLSGYGDGVALDEEWPGGDQR